MLLHLLHSTNAYDRKNSEINGHNRIIRILTVIELGYSSILGIWEDNNLNQGEYKYVQTNYLTNHGMR